MAMGEIVSFPLLGKYGRWGNSLFQIAVTISYGLSHGKQFVFPSSWEYHKYYKNKLPIMDNPPIHQVYVEPHFHYAPIPNLPGNVELRGHFQSIKYWQGHESEVRHYLCDLEYEYIAQVNNNWNRLTFPARLQKRTCGIHVRRGDYTIPPNPDFHGLLQLEYYEKAAKFLYGDNLDDILFIIFSDDIPWCKNTFRFPNQVFSEGQSDVVDLFSMALCGDYIMSNSSYAWFGAWIGENASKRVVCPRSWFNNAPHNSRDIHCPDRIIL